MRAVWLKLIISNVSGDKIDTERKVRNFVPVVPPPLGHI